MKKRHLCGLLIALLLCGCQETLEEKCARECRQYTSKNCPADLGDNTIIDSMVFDASTRTICNYYTLTGPADSVGRLTSEEAREKLAEALRNTTMMRHYKEAGYNFAYKFRSQSRPELVLIDETLTANDYR